MSHRETRFTPVRHLYFTRTSPTVARAIDLSIREAEEAQLHLPASMLQSRQAAYLRKHVSRGKRDVCHSLSELCPSDSSYLAKRSFSDPFKHMVLGEHDGPLSGPSKSIDTHFARQPEQ